MKKIKVLLLISLVLTAAVIVNADSNTINTFSIAAFDPETGEVGVAVASRFFGVGAVVPWAKAGVGAVATQAYANTSFGWRGLDLLEQGLTPQEAIDVLVRSDDRPGRRQVGIVSVDGLSATYTGTGCSDWAGGRFGDNYAVQGNILTGEEVVVAMEKAFLETDGTLADRMYAALLAGESNGGDSRGKQSAAIYIVKENAGYGGYTDQAIDIRVDDHPEPFKELGRLLQIAQMNYSWNVAWTLFSDGAYDEALPPMERTSRLAPENGEVWYDLAVIRLAAGNPDEALDALEEAFRFNPKLKEQANVDTDLENLRDNGRFNTLLRH